MKMSSHLLCLRSKERLLERFDFLYKRPLLFLYSTALLRNFKEKGGVFLKPVYLLGFIPFIGILVGSVFASKVNVIVLGMPFLLFWHTLWLVISSGIMLIIYKFDPINKEENE